MGAAPLGFSTNLSGKKTVAMILPSLSDPFFAQMAQSAEKECRRAGLRLLLVTSGGNLDLEAREVMTLSEQVAGLMIFPVGMRATPYEACRKHNVPVVFIDRGVGSVEAPTVRTDNEEAGFLAGTHLLSLERPVWLVTQPLGWIPTSDERVRGFRRALEEKGLPFETSRILQAHGGDDYVGATLMRHLMALPEAKKPFGLLALSETIARGCYAVLQELKRPIPEHVAVVTFGNTLSASFEPPTSSVSLGEENWGSDAAALLIRALNGEQIASPAPI